MNSTILNDPVGWLLGSWHLSRNDFYQILVNLCLSHVYFEWIVKFSKRSHRKESQKRTNKKADKVENCDEVNSQSKYQNDTDYGTVNNAFEYGDMEETDFGEIWKEKNPEIASTKSTNSAFEVTSFTKCVKHIYKTQGFLSFWNGNFANCLRYM